MELKETDLSATAQAEARYEVEWQCMTVALCPNCDKEEKQVMAFIPVVVKSNL